MVERSSLSWRNLLVEAMSELDIQTLPVKIALAEFAICRSLIQARKYPQAVAQRRILKQALVWLSILKRRHFPAWNSKNLSPKTAW